MEDLLGYSRDEFLGKELWELGLLQDSRANQEAFVELQKKGHIRYNDLPLQTKHGERRDIEFISNVCSAAEPKRRLPNLSTQNMAPLTSGIGYSITPLPIFPDRPAMENRVRFSDPFSFVSAGLMLPGVQPESGNAPFITTQFDVFVTWPPIWRDVTVSGGGTGAFRAQLAAITTNASQIRRLSEHHSGRIIAEGHRDTMIGERLPKELDHIVCPTAQPRKPIRPGSRMQGTFNGLLLKRIIALKSCGTMSGVTLTTFRVFGKSNRELEERLWLKAPALLILSSEEVEGTLVHYTADLRGGFYEITIESK